MNPFKNDRQSFEIAYGQYADMLYRVAFSYLKSKEDAEDVVQDVFTKYFGSMHMPMNPEQEKAWFIRVTMNQCHDTMRKKRYRIHETLDEVTQMPQQEDEDTSPLYEALDKLPEKLKGVIILHYLEGYSVDETARILQLSVSAVKMRLKRGREFLKVELGKE